MVFHKSSHGIRGEGLKIFWRQYQSLYDENYDDWGRGVSKIVVTSFIDDPWFLLNFPILYFSVSFFLPYFSQFSFLFSFFFSKKSLKLKDVHSPSLENDIKVDAFGISNFYFDSVFAVVVVKHIEMLFMLLLLLLLMCCYCCCQVHLDLLLLLLFCGCNAVVNNILMLLFLLLLLILLSSTSIYI